MPIGAVRQSSLAALRLGVRRAPHFALAPNRGDPDTADRYRVPWFLLMEWEETAGCSREDHPRPAANERPFWGHEGRFPPPGLNGRYRFSKLSASVDQDF